MKRLLPLYYQIKHTIRNWISNKELSPGQKIPSTYQLAERFKVNHLTVRQAIEELVQEGFLVSKRGLGTFVSENENLIHSLSIEITGFMDEIFYEIQKALKKEDIKLRVGSKAQDNYIAKVAEWIEHDPPLFFIQKHCKETIRQIERWVYIDGVPSSEGHFPENIGRFSQTGLKWTEPHPEEEIDHAAIARKLQAPLTIPAMP